MHPRPDLLWAGLGNQELGRRMSDMLKALEPSGDKAKQETTPAHAHIEEKPATVVVMKPKRSV